MVRCSLNGRWLMTRGTKPSSPEKDTCDRPENIQNNTNRERSASDANGASCPNSVSGTIPGSVYSFLLDAGLMEDPYYRDNELTALKLMEDDYTFSRVFTIPDDCEKDDETGRAEGSIAESSSILSCEHQILHFDGIDTLSEVRLNGVVLGRTDNMHITWEFDVRGILRSGENVLEVTIFSPTRFIREADRKYHLGGSDEAMRGFPHLRKAHCMFGWDWGPRLPDGGIWRDVRLEGWNESRIEEIRIRQVHLIKKYLPEGSDLITGEACVTSGEVYSASGAPDYANAAREGCVCVDLTVDVVQSGNLPVSIQLTGPDGFEANLENGKPFRIENPELWWPNGLGAQPLYEVRASLLESARSLCFSDLATTQNPETTATQKSVAASQNPEATATQDSALCRVVDTQTRRIGLRTLTIRRDKDEWGESFAMEANGQCVFSMGADYIPEDNILSRMNKERTRTLLENCCLAHFNVIRVWGGGCYPADWFFDLCDEMGLVVWQDMMFACANYRLTDEFVASIRTEITQNVRRIRHHPSLGLWCGNNEMEQFALERAYDGNDTTSADYLIQNEFIIPEIVKKEDPDAFYWPSSPSSGGRFDLPMDPNRGDIHFWAVWHAGVPFTEYRKYYFRYMSEFGFQSFPCMETIRSFTEEEDRNIFSYVMEMHQRNSGANGKILQYLSATYKYPTSFETLLYASQLLQADAIRYGVEHLRRNRDNNRCMGAVYWQLNDIWPVASWASLDWYNRWKALHYAAVRFFAPVLLSCEENSMVSRGETCITEPRRVTGVTEPRGEACTMEPLGGTCDAESCGETRTKEPLEGTCDTESGGETRITEPSKTTSITEPCGKAWQSDPGVRDVWENTARLNISNETWDRVKGEVIWELRTPDSSVLESGTFAVDVAPFSTQWCEELDFSAYDPRIVHLTYRMSGDGAVADNCDAVSSNADIGDRRGYTSDTDNSRNNAPGTGMPGNHIQSGSVLFVAPKHYRFADPQLTVCQGPAEGEITVSSKAYARYVEIYSENGYIRTDDNFFDMEAGTRTIQLLQGSVQGLRVRSVYDIQ